MNSLLGKVLRIDPRSWRDLRRYRRATPTPADTDADEIYHLGLRNPFGSRSTAANGDLIIGDVGGPREEVTLVPAGTPPGATSAGRRARARASGRRPQITSALRCSTRRARRARSRAASWCGTPVPELTGRYLYADFYEGDIRATTLSPEAGSRPCAPDRPRRDPTSLASARTTATAST